METPLFSSRPWHLLLALLACALFLVTPAQADPAGRIGRIAWLSGPGAVNLYNPNTGESYSAALNQPLTSGDTLNIAAGSRAEIQIGSMSIRLDSGTMLEIVRIDDEQVGLYLNDGRAIVKLPSREVVGDFELVTRNGRFGARDAGIYRFDADAGSSGATAYFGSLRFEASDSTLDIGAGQSAQFWQQGDGQTRYRLSSVVNDDFTAWSVTRDQRPTGNTYARYVSPEMTGAEDLDAYGNWSENAEYGAIWTPRAVAADWAPYRSGHWVWVAPWGWNWVGYEPWGFAPFHYGRWVHHHGRWGWVPGRRIARPVYAPAMVAWIGSPGIGGSIAIGRRPNVGWFPLAPHEVYVPAYRSSPKHVREINSSHVKNIGNVTTIVSNPQSVVQHTRYRHRELPHAVTVVPADVITHRRSVSPAALSPRDHRSLRDQPVQALAPVSAPQAAAQNGTRNRQDRPNPTFPRREIERPGVPATLPAAPGPANANPPTASTAPPVSSTTVQPGARPMPETVRPATQSRPEVVAPVRQNASVPASAAQAPQQVGSQNWQNWQNWQNRQNRQNWQKGQNPQERQERPGQPFDQRDRQPQGSLVIAPGTPGNSIGNPQAASAVPQVPATTPPRGEPRMPEMIRPATQSRPEAVAPARQNAAAPASAMQTAPRFESQNLPNAQNSQYRQERLDRPGQPQAARERQQQEAPVTAPVAPGSRNSTLPVLAAPSPVPSPSSPVPGPQRNEQLRPETIRPVQQYRPEPIGNSPPATRTREVIPAAPTSMPQLPAVAPQRSERPMPEVVRPVPQSRPVPLEARTQDRTSRREEPAMTPPQRPIRIEPQPQQVKQAAPARVETPPPMTREIRREAPRENMRSGEPRTEVRTQSQGDRQRSGQNDPGKQSHQRGQADQR